MRLYYNDSSQVKKCLNYEEFTSEYCVCLCLHKTCQIMREKTPSKYGNHFSHLKQTNARFYQLGVIHEEILECFPFSVLIVETELVIPNYYLPSLQ